MNGPTKQTSNQQVKQPLKTLFKTLVKLATWSFYAFLALIALALLSNKGERATQATETKKRHDAPAVAAPVASSVAASSAATPAPSPEAAVDPMRSQPTEKDKAEAREWARQVARTNTNDAIWAKINPEKARVHRLKHGPGLTVEQYAEFEAGNEEMFDTSQYKSLYPKNVAMQKWFVKYTVPLVKEMMGNAAVIFRHHGQDGSTAYFYDLKDHPEKIEDIARRIEENEKDEAEEAAALTAKKAKGSAPGASAAKKAKAVKPAAVRVEKAVAVK
jgi:hypothetical protein